MEMEVLKTRKTSGKLDVRIGCKKWTKLKIENDESALH